MAESVVELVERNKARLSLQVLVSDSNVQLSVSWTGNAQPASETLQFTVAKTGDALETAVASLHAALLQTPLIEDGVSRFVREQEEIHAKAQRKAALLADKLRLEEQMRLNMEQLAELEKAPVLARGVPETPAPPVRADDGASGHPRVCCLLLVTDALARSQT